MKKKRMNPYGAALILLGVAAPLAAFFGALWQSHPDPSAVRPGEVAELVLVLSRGESVFRDSETGEVLPLSEMRDGISEREAQRIAEEESFIAGRVEVGVLHIIVGGVLMIIAGAFFPSSVKKD